MGESPSPAFLVDADGVIQRAVARAAEAVDHLPAQRWAEDIQAGMPKK